MERIYCSQAAQGETLSGTADQVDVWLMLEYRPSWGARVVDDNDLSEDVRRWLSEQVGRLRDRGLVVRPQFIRQPEIDRSDTRLLLGFDDTLTMVSCEGYRDLLDLHLCDVLDEGATQVLTEPNYFVCTNGQRDLCCARFGLPAYAALREIAGERAWQTTHLGGHRFAPNVLVLPQGVMYGRVTAESVDTFASLIEGGELAFDQLRGRTRYPRAVQAAEAAIGQNGLRLLHVQQGKRTQRVTFAARDGRYRVVVSGRDRADVLASCGDVEHKDVISYESERVED